MKVYVSSTVADMEQEREAVIDWLVDAGHQPFHSYRPNSETVRDACLKDIEGCDLYVLIAGHRYGFQPKQDNPDRLSITHLEFRRAGELGIPRVVLMRTSVPDVSKSDLLDAERMELVKAFRIEVEDATTPGMFADLEDLLSALSTGFLGEVNKVHQRTVDRLMGEVNQERVEKEELRKQLDAAVARTFSAAEAPGATLAEVAAAVALRTGDTRPAAALLREEERQAKSAEANDPQERAQLAALAREQGALAMGRDVTAALAAYQRAAEHDPGDVWTHIFIGDLHRLQGSSDLAMQNYVRAMDETRNLLRLDPANTQWQRDLSVSYNKIGDVLVAQGEGDKALRSYQDGLAIRTQLAKRDPANTEWQVDVAVSCSKLGTLADQPASTCRAYLERGRTILADLKSKGRLAPTQDWIAWFDKELGKLP